MKTGKNDIYLPNKNAYLSSGDYYTKEETDNKFATKTDLKKCCDGVNAELENKADKTEIPTKTSQLTNDSGYLTEHQSLDEYYTKTQTDTKLNDYALKTDIPVVPSKVSAFENDKGYLTEHQSLEEYYTKADIDTKLDAKADANALTTEIEERKADTANINKVIEDNEKVIAASLNDLNTKLGNKADKDAIPTKTSQLTNDSGYLTEHQSLDEYYTKVQTDTKLNNYALKSEIPDVPTKTSQLTNDSDFATNAEIEVNYYNKEEVDAKIAGGGTFDPTNYYTKTDTNNLLDAKADKTALEAVSSSLGTDYYTKTQTDGKLADYAKKTELPTKTSELTNDSDFATNAGIADNYYNKQEVDNKITQSGTFDPSQYYTKTDTNNLLDAKADKTALGQYALKTDIPVVPTKVSAFENDKGYLTEHQSLDEYYTKTETDTKLNDYALKSEIPSVPTKTSELTNDSGFVNGGGIQNIWQGTASEYEAITSKSNTTLYLVTE